MGTISQFLVGDTPVMVTKGAFGRSAAVARTLQGSAPP